MTCTRIGSTALLWLAAVALAASVIDNVTGALGTRYGGATRWGASVRVPERSSVYHSACRA